MTTVAYFQESRKEAIAFSKADFEEFDPSLCYPYFLNDRQVALIVSCLRYAGWDSRWDNRDIDSELVESTHLELMSACDELKLIRLEITRIANALFQSPAATEVLEVISNGIVDNQETSIGSTLFNLTESSQDYSDEILEVAGELVTIAALL